MTPNQVPQRKQEAYDNMWQKTRSTWAYIHDNYLDEFDFFWLGGDDFLLIVENLRNFLATLDNTGVLYLGNQIPDRGNPGTYFCGGGAGYVLNKLAVKRLATEVLPNCAVSSISSIVHLIDC